MLEHASSVLVLPLPDAAIQHQTLRGLSKLGAPAFMC